MAIAIVLIILRFVNLFAAAVVAGGQIYVFRVVMPVKKNFDDRSSIQMHNAMLGHQTDHYMKPAGIISFLTALALVALALVAMAVAGVTPLPTISIVLLCIGMLGTTGVALLSRYRNVPTNAMMLTWSLDDIPQNYHEVRARWDLVHTFRVICGVTAFTFYLLATLVDHLPQSG